MSSASALVHSPNDPLLSIADVAIALGASKDTVRRRIADGSLPAVRVGGRLIRIRRSDVDALLRPIPSVAAIA